MNNPRERTGVALLLAPVAAALLVRAEAAWLARAQHELDVVVEVVECLKAVAV